VPQRIRRRASLADCVAPWSAIREAKELFEEAEILLNQNKKFRQILKSFAGHQYCDLLITLKL